MLEAIKYKILSLDFRQFALHIKNENEKGNVHGNTRKI